MVERMYRPEDVKLLVPDGDYMVAVPVDRVKISVDDEGRHLGYLVNLADLPKPAPPPYPRRPRDRYTLHTQVIDSPGLPDGYVPPPASLDPTGGA